MMKFASGKYFAATTLAATILIAGCATESHGGSATASITHEPFGVAADGSPVEIYTLRNNNGMEVRLLTYGGIIQTIKVPDKHGQFGDVVLGYDTLDGYWSHKLYCCPLIGRYANRIAGGHFTLDGQKYTLAINSGVNSMHGGFKGFNKKVWTVVKADIGGKGPELELSYTSPDGEEGYPGTLQVTATYTLFAKENALRLEFEATTDKDTIVNLTSHCYFNLAGQGTILDDVVYINADKYTPVDSTLIPTGELAPVAGTPLDFRAAAPIGARIDDDNEQLEYGGGYDHNFVINHKIGKLGLDAHVMDPKTGRVLEVWSTEPGLQFNSGNSLRGDIVGKYGIAWPHHGAFALEPQHYPDSPNHPNFPSTELRPGEVYHNTIEYKFGVE
jgi:aldose 1-epimerase